VQACIDAGAMVPGDAERVASYLWAVTHGMVSLELAGYYPDPDTAAHRFRAMLYASIAGYLARRPQG
jgi:hypothetical protein